MKLSKNNARLYYPHPDHAPKELLQEKVASFLRDRLKPEVKQAIEEEYPEVIELV